MSSATALDALPPLSETIAREGADDRSREPGDLPPTTGRSALVERGGSPMKLRITGLAALALALTCPVAHAATFTATVRVEGQDRTLLPATPVTLQTDAPKSVHLTDADCDGDTAAAALDQATGGNWDRSQFTSTILGETHKFDNNDYWAEWVDNKQAQVGICDQKLTPGAKLLMLVDVSPPPDYSSTVFPIAINGAPASANTGDTATVTVVQYKQDGTSAPLSGATLSGAGPDVKTGGDGRATVTFDKAGQASLRAVKASERSEVVGVCVHSGDDGTCGTARPGGSPAAGDRAGASGAGGGGSADGGQPAATSTAPSLTEDVTAPRSRLALTDGHVYARGQGPRVLAGSVGADPSGLLMVKIRLTRNDGGKCSSYSSTRERFIRTRCGAAHGWFFKLGTDAAWSYLLPERLGPGRYVLDVKAIDNRFNRDDARRRGENRAVFTVR